MGISLFQISENELNNNVMAEKILEKLENKYNRKFLIKKIGNRYGDGGFDTVVAYCTPADAEKMVFKVTFNMSNEELVEDNYYIRDLCFKIEDEVENELKNKNIESINKLEIIGKNCLDKMYTVSEFLNKFSNSNFLDMIVIKDAINENDLNEIFQNIRNKYANIKFKGIIFVIDKNGFEKDRDEMRMLPEITKSYMEQYLIKESRIIKIDDNEIINLK